MYEYLLCTQMPVTIIVIILICHEYVKNHNVVDSAEKFLNKCYERKKNLKRCKILVEDACL